MQWIIRDALRGRTLWEPRKKMALCKSRGEALEPDHTLILNCQPPELCENKFLLFKPTILWLLQPGQTNTWQLASCDQAMRERIRKHPRQKPLSFYNLTLEVTSHNFCWILFVRNGSVSLVCTLERKLLKGMSTSRQASHEVAEKAAYHTSFVLPLVKEK